MALQKRLAAGLKDAMRQGDATRRLTIRLAMAAIHNVEIAQGKPLNDNDIFGVIAREAKQRRDSIAEFAKGNRQDLVAKEEAEIAILLEYLPQQMSYQEVALAAKKVIDDVGARGLADKGKVMKELMSQVKGRAEGQLINTVVTELLSGREG